ncbi:hypothetical protein [Spongiivirga citrea]|uniref:Uncharacterized protein n=1 Tax=Spongiivirga citrea TaxID=1481457 RepID=A0A6M0CRH9_9FLAO|nr:hypothetical protein [Spongiivirga citrea]NER18684.1 hypothetical protein [Spongiivirga citrea]
MVNLIPHNTGIIIKANDLNTLKSNIKNHDFFNLFNNTSLNDQILSKFKLLGDLDFDNDVILCISNEGKKQFEFTLITSNSEALQKSLSDSKWNISTASYLNNTINTIKIDEDEIYHLILDDLIVISTSKLLSENTIRHYKSESHFTSDSFKKLFKSVDANAPFSLVINMQDFGNLFTSAFPNIKKREVTSLADWIAIDTDINNDHLQINGIVTASDSLNQRFNLIKGLSGHALQSINITPTNSTSLKAFTFEDFTTLHANINKQVAYTGAPVQKEFNPIFSDIDEIGHIKIGEQNVIVLHSTDVIATNQHLESEKNKAKTFRDVSIFNFSKSDLFAKNTPIIIAPFEVTYYFKSNDLYVFSNNLVTLQDIIASYQNNSTIAKDENYRNSKNQLSEETSFTWLANTKQFKSVLKTAVLSKKVKEIDKLNFNQYPWIALQLDYQNDFGYINATIKKKQGATANNTVAQLASVTLDSKISSKMQLITNHRSKQKEIVVQDENNVLYLISNKGNILWKKQLESKIVGDIKQVDLYKNGRLQLIFNTPNQLHVLDRNGKVVAPYPISFEDEITQSIAVFDYDKSRNYRFIITQNNNLLMLNAEGKTVKGFEFSKAASNLMQAPKHFRSAGKDYIVFPTTDGTMHILNRRGQNRIKVDKKINFSNNPVHFYQNKFTVTDTDGLMHIINTNGKTEVAKLGLEKEHDIVTTSKTLVSLSDNTLTIKKKKVKLDYGLYTKPSIFYINDKIYVSVTDTQAKKVYVFDSNAKLLPNFPVYGTSMIDMENIDKDRSPEFIVQGEEDSILIYGIN